MLKKPTAQEWGEMLVNNLNENVRKDHTMNKLTKEFEKALENCYKDWKHRRSADSRDGVRFRGQLTRFGAMEVARRALNPKKFKTVIKQHEWIDPDVTLEGLIVTKFWALFSPAEIYEAYRRYLYMQAHKV